MRTFRIIIGALLVGYFLAAYVFPKWDMFETGEGHVYSVPVESSEECTKYEQYDAEHRECFFECVKQAECDEILDKIDAAFDELEYAYGVYNTKPKHLHSITDVYEEVENIEAHYNILRDEKLDLMTGEKLEDHEFVWDMFARISPNEISNKHISAYIPYNDATSDTAAFVVNQDDGTWHVFVNMDVARGEADGSELLFTLVHEFGHILTLSTDQVDHNTLPEACTTFYTGEGCAKDTSWINMFVEQFWTEDMIAYVDAGNDNLAQKTMLDFVSDYAGTNPGEDIAETFAAFVLDNRVYHNTVAEKNHFFQNDPVFEKLREQIRRALRKELQAN